MLAPVSVPDRQTELAKDLQEACYYWDTLLDKLSVAIQQRDNALAAGNDSEAVELAADVDALMAAAEKAKRHALSIGAQLAVYKKQKTA